MIPKQELLDLATDFGLAPDQLRHPGPETLLPAALEMRMLSTKAPSDNDRARAIEIDPIYAEILKESKEGGGDEDPA